jgi:hypothetical protein
MSVYPTIPLYDIVKKWRDKLSGSTAISGYCQEQYGKGHTVFVGVNLKRPPDEKDCPYIVILPGASIEGEVEELKYAINIGWAIKNENQTVDGNVVELEGIEEVSELGELILAEVAEANPSYPVTEVTTTIEPVEYFPQLVGEMELTIGIEPVIGAGITY